MSMSQWLQERFFIWTFTHLGLTGSFHLKICLFWVVQISDISPACPAQGQAQDVGWPVIHSLLHQTGSADGAARVFRLYSNT